MPRKSAARCGMMLGPGPGHGVKPSLPDYEMDLEQPVHIHAEGPGSRLFKARHSLALPSPVGPPSGVILANLLKFYCILLWIPLFTRLLPFHQVDCSSSEVKGDPVRSHPHLKSRSPTVGDFEKRGGVKPLNSKP